MFKVLILHTLYDLADLAVEYQIRDRLSFMRILGLEMYDSVPDGAAVWRFRERLKELELIKPLLDRFGDYLSKAGLEARDGQIIDGHGADSAQQPRGESPHQGRRRD
jgi:IS5 family transposase